MGLARVLPFSATLKSSTPSLIGPVQWMSPEAHRGEFSRATDVYMFGATLLESVTRRASISTQLAADSLLNLVSGLVDSGKTPPRPSAAVCPAPLWALIERSWTHRPAERSTMYASCLPARLNGCLALAVSSRCCFVQIHSELLRVASLLDGGPQPAATPSYSMR